MAKQVISLVSDTEQKKDKFAFQIQNGQMTNAVFNGLSTDDQQTVKDVLFNMYTEGKLNTYASLSGLEFAVIGLAKMFLQLVPYAPNATPTDFDNFYSQYKNAIDQHDLPLQGSTWQLSYLLNQIQTTMTNRTDYKSQKQQITGSF